MVGGRGYKSLQTIAAYPCFHLGMLKRSPLEYDDINKRKKGCSKCHYKIIRNEGLNVFRQWRQRGGAKKAYVVLEYLDICVVQV